VLKGRINTLGWIFAAFVALAPVEYRWGVVTVRSNEGRNITLFSDIRGFSMLSETRPPEGREKEARLYEHRGRNHENKLRLALGAACMSAAFSSMAEVGYALRAIDLKAKPYMDAHTVAKLPEKAELELVARNGPWMS
jgi:hypothetical protein